MISEPGVTGESGSDWDPEAADAPDLTVLRGDAERADRLKKSPSAFRTISEVADDLHIPQHVLRFWETRFPQVKPLKRGGGRRYYRPDDIALLRRISELLYIQGYTIKGVQRLLREGDGTLTDVPPPDPADAEPDPLPGPAAGPAAGDEPGGGPADILPPPTRPDPVVFPVMAESPAAATPGAPAAADADAARLRATLRDVLDELRLLRGQISA